MVPPHHKDICTRQQQSIHVSNNMQLLCAMLVTFMAYRAESAFLPSLHHTYTRLAPSQHWDAMWLQHLPAALTWRTFSGRAPWPRLV